MHRPPAVASGARVNAYLRAYLILRAVEDCCSFLTPIRTTWIKRVVYRRLYDLLVVEITTCLISQSIGHPSGPNTSMEFLPTIKPEERLSEQT